MFLHYNLVLRILFLSFPILIVIGPFALNCFSIIFSIYAIKNFLSFKIIINNNKKFLLFFFSFIFLIFPFHPLDFNISFNKYLSFFRFVFMFFGIIIFLSKNNQKSDIILRSYKLYFIYLIVIIFDVLVEYFYGSNIFGYTSSVDGRIASFTNDELIIGYIFAFLAIYSLPIIQNKSNIFYFFLIILIILSVSFLIGERSNFIKLSTIIILFSIVKILFFEKIRSKKNLLSITTLFTFAILIFLSVKSTTQFKKLYDPFDQIFDIKGNKLSLNFKEEFYNSRHAPHYITAYKIFIDHPLFGVGINNFYKESKKSKYKLDPIFCPESLNQCKYEISSTHPHQIYLEIISEVGLLGTAYFVITLLFPIVLSLRKFLITKNLNILTHLLLHIYFIYPVLPSGSFFGTNYGIPLWFNLSILVYLSIEKKLNK